MNQAKLREVFHYTWDLPKRLPDIKDYRYPVDVDAEEFERLATGYLNSLSSTVSPIQLEFMCVSRLAIGEHFVKVGSNALISDYGFFGFGIDSIDNGWCFELLSYCNASIDFLKEIKRLYKDKVIWEGLNPDTLQAFDNLIDYATTRRLKAINIFNSQTFKHKHE